MVLNTQSKTIMVHIILRFIILQYLNDEENKIKIYLTT